MADFSTPPFSEAPAREEPLEFRDETYPAKTRGMGLPYGKKFHNLNFNRFCRIHPCDGRTDRRTDGR